MIGRADIEGSKSNVAVNAWLPQASYPCGNFSDTSSWTVFTSKGSIGHAFTAYICTENENQASFSPFSPHKISVLIELTLGHLRYHLTDVPPQPNSLPDTLFHTNKPTHNGWRATTCKCKNEFHRISKITSRVVVFHDCKNTPTYSTPPESFHNVRLESSSTGSSFPAD